ncbi:MAG: hypothetical protein U5J83_14100, partial [Bryobacterales bacterium]|nr:hypothetical protein [Bryobacterales bacterium]
IAVDIDAQEWRCMVFVMIREMFFGPIDGAPDFHVYAQMPDPLRPLIADLNDDSENAVVPLARVPTGRRP